MRTAIIILVAAGCNGCAEPLRFTNLNGSTTAQFTQDRYTCLRETQQPSTNASADQYSATRTSRVIPSCSAFQACLAAKGYIRSDDGPLWARTEIRCN
jgi:hypothetical protein